MIEIVTLFLGLVSGPQPVELAVHEAADGVEVARAEVGKVEVHLDGQVVERLTSAPWRLEVDLGDDLVPHELVAVAYDDSGRELARAQRWINIDMPRALIDGRVLRDGLTVLPVVFAMDREPSLDEMGDWFLADREPLAARAVHRGPAEVLVVQDPATRPYLEELGRLFLGDRLDRLGIPGKALRKDAPDWDPELLRAPPEQFRDAAMDLFDVPAGAPESSMLDGLWQAYHEFAGLGPETTVRFMSPLAAPVSNSASRRNLFAGSTGVPDVGFFWLVENVPPMGFYRRIADAVAIAGRQAHAGGRRRAVVLLLAAEADDDSLLTASAVRAYLRALRVPLYVWTVFPGAIRTDWGEATFIGLETADRGGSIPRSALDEAFGRLDGAARELRRELGAQRIVLLAGEHLPNAIELAPAAAAGGARPAGLEPPATETVNPAEGAR